MTHKLIYLLIGQKGSGKSFIGMLLDKNFDIRFVRVEDWVKTLKGERSVDNESYIHEVFQIIETGIRKKLKKLECLTFESTGITESFDKMLNNLKKDYRVVTIKVNTDAHICMERIKSRDLSIHINVSDQQIENINRKVREKNIKTEFIIENNFTVENELLKDLEEIIRSVSGKIYNC